MKRRDLLGGAALALLPLPFGAPAQETSSGVAFSYAWLKGKARALAAQAFAAPTEHAVPALNALTWDQYQSIRFRAEKALWAGDALSFRIEFFHLGLHFRRPVRIHVVEQGRAQQLAFEADAFDYARSGLHGAQMPHDLGFAGFRIHFHTDFRRDVAAFLGASYFRAVGAELQYGLSARGLAVDCGMNRPEEFPDFTDFWLERPAAGATKLTLYALLDSPSVAGAYRFDIEPGTLQTMRIDAALYPRKAIERLGVAPLTSMFLCAPHDRRIDNDWRATIHDSDGLALCTRDGEWLWRPLANPAAVRFNAYQDITRGFGLLQRDRVFDHYQDDGAWYDRRPCAWVEPLSGFDDGAVDLLEIPTADETNDNIVAFWNPPQAPQPGQELLYAYKLYWGAQPPAGSPLARTAMTRSGIGGTVGQPHKYFSWRFVVDFAGGELATLDPKSKVESVVTASKGSIQLVSARPLDAIHGYRATFDIRPGDLKDAIDLRLFLRLDGKPLSETWTYQWTPPAPLPA